MSMELMVKAMNLKVGNPLRKLVLIKLADNANDKGECWPSYQHIADQCEISKRSVMNHVEALCEAGLLKKQARKGEKGNTSNTYRLCLDGGAANSPGGGAAPAPGVVQQIHQGSAAAAPPSESPAPGGSAGAAPRTSHSFEPVNEPVNEPDCDHAPDKPVMVEQLPVIPRVEIPADMPGPKDPNCKTFKSWANYAMAYRKRYGVWPLWNAKTGGVLSQFIDRVGVAAAHHVAAFYLTINDARLVTDCHTLTTLLAKVESIHTQWASGRQITGIEARQIERKQANLDAGVQAAERILKNHNRGDRNEFL